MVSNYEIQSVDEWQSQLKSRYKRYVVNEFKRVYTGGA